jgi:DNA polymerase I
MQMVSNFAQVSDKLILPNVRKLFIPDKGMMLFDADLAGADAQVVAAEADDTALLKAFKDGLDVHSSNAEALFGTAFTSLNGNARKAKRQQCKQGVHGTNYGASARTLAQILGWRVAEADSFQRRWFALHPGIRTWHDRTELNLRTSRTASNKFGYRIVYFDRIESLLPQALAWIPQSTVALVCFKGALRLKRELPWVDILLQVHDSLVFQVPMHRADEFEKIATTLEVPIPYPNPLTIAWSLSRSTKSWGDCEKVEWKKANS